MLRDNLKPKFNGPLVYTLLLYVLWSILSAIWSITLDVNSYVILFQNILVFFFISSLSRIEYSELLKYLRVGARLLLVALPIFFSDLILEVSITRLTGAEEELINPNRLATMIGLAGVFSISGEREDRKGMMSNAFFIVLAAILIFATGSRSNSLALISCVILAYSLNGQLSRLIIMFFLLLPFVLYNIDFDSLDYLLKRFSAENMSQDGASVRLETWKTLVPIGVKQHLLTGVGFGALNVYSLAAVNGLSFSAHNLWIDSFLQLGLAGVLIIGFMVILCINIAIQVFFSYGNSILLLLGTYLLILGLAETVFPEKYFFIFLALSNNVKTVGYVKT
jgi:hypothetical protein